MALKSKKSVTFFDIGANKGIMTKFASKIVGENGIIYAAEPCDTTFETLKQETAGINSKVYLINAAFSDIAGTGVLQVVSPNAGTNSLVNGVTHGTETQNVKLHTLDSYTESEGIQGIDFIKIDTEGHDLSVIRGCKKMLEKRDIQCIQFEYNWRWMGQRSYLKDVFDLVGKDSGYRIGKVTCLGIELYDQWQPELETLIENNYTIVKEELIGSIKSIKPWFK